MNRQQPLALAPPAGDADWSERSLLDAATRRALASINQAFLDLAGELAEEGRLKQIPGLPPRAIDSLIELEAGPRLCERLPFALFDLRFADGSFWSVGSGGGGRRAGRDRPARGGRADRRLHARRHHGRLALSRRRALPARGWCSAHRPRPSPRSRACRSPPSNGSRVASRPHCRPASVRARGSGCSSRVARRGPTRVRSNSCGSSGLQIQGAESARGQSLQRRHRRNVA